MKISARNQIKGTIVEIAKGATTAHVRIDIGGAVVTASITNEAVDDFSVRNLGFQIRYRYEVAPLSYLYVVYGRGGYQQDAFSDVTGNLLRDSFSLRDDEQLLVKFSYRFEL